MKDLERDLRDLQHDAKVRAGDLSDELVFRDCDHCTIAASMPEELEAHGCICDRHPEYGKRRALTRTTLRAMLMQSMIEGGSTAEELGMTTTDSMVIAALRRHNEAAKWGASGD